MDSVLKNGNANSSERYTGPSRNLAQPTDPEPTLSQETEILDPETVYKSPQIRRLRMALLSQIYCSRFRWDMAGRTRHAASI
jgi:hypothetical protein